MTLICQRQFRNSYFFKRIYFSSRFIMSSSASNTAEKVTNPISDETNRTIIASDVSPNVNCFADIAEFDTTHYTAVREGKAEVLFPSANNVFYNPVQEFNRDMSVAVLRNFVRRIPKMTKGLYPKLLKKMAFEELDIKVLEALSASGLRSVRYAKEVEGISEVVANDFSTHAYESIIRNIQHNKVEDIVTPCNKDAIALMHLPERKFDAIDLDPYGTASPFLDSAVQAVNDGGLLMVTCTDMAVLCGNGIEACHAKYGAVSMKIGCCHEMALRILLQCIESHANRHGRYIEPLLSLSIDFYVRVFVQVFTGPIMVKKSICKLSNVYVCQGCGSYHFQPLGVEVKTEKGVKYTPGPGPPVGRKCDICNRNFKVGGPIWTSNLHNKDFIKDLLERDFLMEGEEEFKTSKRIEGMLHLAAEELDDCPLFHKVEKLCTVLHVVSPTLVQFRSALMNAGYRVSTSHCMPTSIKTDAPQHVIWDIIKEWAQINPGKLTFENELSSTIMRKPIETKVDFTIRPDANPGSRFNGLLRFQQNPSPHWGPRSRAHTTLSSEETEKRKKFQGKRKKKENCCNQEEEDSFKKTKKEPIEE